MKETPKKKCGCAGWNDEGVIHEPTCPCFNGELDETPTEEWAENNV